MVTYDSLLEVDIREPDCWAGYEEDNLDWWIPLDLEMAALEDYANMQEYQDCMYHGYKPEGN